MNPARKQANGKRRTEDDRAGGSYLRGVTPAPAPFEAQRLSPRSNRQEMGGEVEVPSPSLSLRLVARWSDSKASAISAAGFLSSRPLRKMFVLFHSVINLLVLVHTAC